MALTPNLRKVGSLLVGNDVFGEHDSRVTDDGDVTRSPGIVLKDVVVVFVAGETLAERTGRLKYGEGLLIRRRSSTRKLE